MGLATMTIPTDAPAAVSAASPYAASPFSATYSAATGFPIPAPAGGPPNHRAPPPRPSRTPSAAAQATHARVLSTLRQSAAARRRSAGTGSMRDWVGEEGPADNEVMPGYARLGAAAAPLGGGEHPSDGAYERVRAALPRASSERRMFHTLANIQPQPEGSADRARRVSETFGYGAPLAASMAEPCCICLESLEQHQIGLTLPCGHLFHENCIHEWLGRKPCCPLCKHKLGI